MKKTIKIKILIALIIILGVSIFFIHSNKSNQDKKTAEEKNLEVDITEDISNSKPAESPVVISTDQQGKNEEADLVDDLAEMPEDTSPPIIVKPEDVGGHMTKFEEYNSMSESRQKDFYESFESPDAFFEWYNSAKAEYEKNNGDIILDGSTNVEMKP